jgi:hypothetical protein
MRKSVAIFLASALVLVTLATPAVAQLSPPGKAATQVGAGYDKWIEVTFSRPILRGRRGILAEGDNYGQRVNAGAPVWRAGADVSTRFRTEVDLMFGTHKLEAGEYSLFIDLKGPTNWELIVSNHGAKTTFNRDDDGKLWGAYGYQASEDVFRVPMFVGPPIDFSMDQLSWYFTDVTEGGGTLNIIWDRTIAQAAFTVAN